MPVNKVKRIKSVLGGAANVAANLAHLECRVFMGGVTGADNNREVLEAMMAEKGIDYSGLIKSQQRETITKMRILGAQQQMLRLNTIVRSYRAGDDVIFSMPEKNGLFLVLSGGVRVFIATDTGREITLMSIVSGGCCMLNTLDSAAPGDTVPILQATSDAVFAYINIVALRPLCAESPVVQQFLQCTQARNVQTVLNNIEYYFFHPLRSCIARVVLEKADAHPEDGFARITHEEISHHLGTTREVISRELEGMRQMGLLRTGRGKIYVLDRPALEGMANL